MRPAFVSLLPAFVPERGREDNAAFDLGKMGDNSKFPEPPTSTITHIIGYFNHALIRDTPTQETLGKVLATR